MPALLPGPRGLVTITSGAGSGGYKKKGKRGKADGIIIKKREGERL
jgi:hypothetical protein